MPRLRSANPSYRHHKASGQAVVTFDGADHYLGPHGSKASRNEYDRLIQIWLAHGRQMPESVPDLAVSELLLKYLHHARTYYRKAGSCTGEFVNIAHAARPLKALFGRESVKDFGPLKLKAVRQRMIDAGLSRNTVNSRIGRIKRIFRWAVGEELAPASLCHGLDAVEGLKAGRSAARETKPVLPIDDATVAATLPFMPPVVADMVQLQRLLGCRPGEVCMVRPCDIDRSDEVWQYRPGSHKTQHHCRDRVILVGPRAQAILLPYLLRDPSSYCFSPADGERKRKAALRENRVSSVQPSQQDRRKHRPKVQPTNIYTKDSYARAVRRACDKAGVERWAPNRLRHTAATQIRAVFGLDGAQAVLGHARAQMTEHYAERDMEKAAAVMRQIG